LFRTLLLCLLAIGEIQATSITVTFDEPTLRGSPGDVLTFSASVVNSGTERIYLNADILNLPGAGLTGNDLFFANVPSWLESGESLQHLSLFSITLDDPFGGEFTSYFGTYSLLGGIDGASQDELATVPFGVTAVAPEPLPGAMSACGLLVAVLLRRFGGQLSQD
jgi:hypothetical protein